VNDGNTVTFGYDEANRLTDVGGMHLSRDLAEGRLSGSALGVVTDALSYSPAGDLSGYTASTNATPVLDLQYVRDGLGRIGSKTDTFADPNNQQPNNVTAFDYTYDNAGRLIDVAKNGLPVSHYTYDANGNRVSGFNQQCPTIVATSDDQDRLLSYTCGPSTTTYTHTPNGELLSKTETNGAVTETTTYAYDVLGNLLEVVLPDGTEIEYVVDGLNRRIGKKVDGVLVQGLLYQDQLEPIAELDGSGNVVARFVYGSKPHVPDYLIVPSPGTENRQPGTYRLISDHLGSVRLVIDTTTGAIAQRIDYDEFGNVLADTTPGFQPFGFAGGLYDTDTGLVLFGVRDYDPGTGRWTAKDPIRFGGGDTNLYGYVVGDPENWIDPDGRIGGWTAPGYGALGVWWAFITYQVYQYAVAIQPMIQAQADAACAALLAQANQGGCSGDAVYIPIGILNVSVQVTVVNGQCIGSLAIAPPSGPMA
jgi:RHS repeat-associated protein